MAFFIEFRWMEVCFNGAFFSAGTPLLPVQNRSYKWGDGLFETMKLYKAKLLLESLHFERMFTSLKLLGIEKEKSFTQEKLVSEIRELSERNQCLQNARIRLAVFRNEENKTEYSIEALPLEDSANEWQADGQVIVLYPYARKSIDAFAGIKSANYLPYLMAHRYAAEQKADDALVLNSNNRLCDASKANLFIIKEKTLYTPALHQGCINGVMRRVVLHEAKRLGLRVHQDEVSEEALLNADEVFLTNAIQILRWVKAYKNKTYECTQTRLLYNVVRATIFHGLC